MYNLHNIMSYITIGHIKRSHTYPNSDDPIDLMSNDEGRGGVEPGFGYRGPNQVWIKKSSTKDNYREQG